MTPNLAAGAPIEGTIIKCPIEADQSHRLQGRVHRRPNEPLAGIFPDGVCDWSKPGVEETDNSVTWASFGPSRKNLIFDINNPR
jgi:hypothetical protein